MPTFFLTNGDDTFPGGQPGWINTGEDIVHGLDGEDSIDGGALNDTVNGNNGNDTLLGGAGADALNGGADNDDLDGGVGNDTLAGEGGNDILQGGDNDDTLRGGAGNDQIFGDDGNDTFDVFGDVVGATDVDVLSGGANNDTIVTAIIEGTAATISFDGGSGTDTVAANGSILGYTFSNIEVLENRFLIRATAAQINQFGTITDANGLSDITDIQVTTSGTIDFTGRLGAGVIKLKVILQGVSNTITAGAGDDRIEVGSATTGAMVLNGGDGNDSLLGGFGNDVLDGGAGNDEIDGSSGFDFVTYAGASAGVTVSLNIAGPQNTVGAGVDTLGVAGIEGVIGSAHGDTLTSQSGLFQTGKTLDGRAGNDILTGGNWHDILIGGAGNDTLVGGDGFDTADYSTATGAVVVSLAVVGAQNTGGAGADTLSQMENLTGSGFSDVLTGDGAANHLRGGAGNDTLTGGAGNDILDGGLGNDTLAGGADIDTVDFAAATGPISVNLTLAGAQNTGQGLDTFSGIENLIGSAFADTFTGQNLLNRFDGGGGDDELRGGSGNDTLNGDAGADLIVGDSGNDAIDGGADVDRLYGGTGNDTIFGGASADTIVGGPGVDRVDGGAGADRLYADGTADTFVFASAAGTGDRVFSFLTGIHDIEIDASVFGGSAGAFAYVQGATPTPGGALQALLYDTDDGKLYFDADGAGAGARIHLLTLYLAPTLATGDIVLV